MAWPLGFISFVGLLERIIDTAHTELLPELLRDIVPVLDITQDTLPLAKGITLVIMFVIRQAIWALLVVA